MSLLPKTTVISHFQPMSETYDIKIRSNAISLTDEKIKRNEDKKYTHVVQYSTNYIARVAAEGFR